MKLYLIDYEWEPGGPETSVILADSREEAIKLSKAEIEEPIKSVTEIKTDKSKVIYIGFYCC